MDSWSACKPCDSVTVGVIVSKGGCADDGPHAIRSCDETTISNRWRRRARRRGAHWYRRIGDAPLPIPRGLSDIYISLPFPLWSRAGWGHGDTNRDGDADTSTHTSDGHDPGAGVPAEHGPRLRDRCSTAGPRLLRDLRQPGNAVRPGECRHAATRDGCESHGAPLGQSLHEFRWLRH